MRLLEAAPRTAGISGDERATLVIASQLLRDIVQRAAGTGRAGPAAFLALTAAHSIHWRSHGCLGEEAGMRRILLLIAPLALLGCSRPAAAPDAAPAAIPASTDQPSNMSPTAVPDGDPPAAQSPSVDPLFAAVAADAEPPSVMLNRYVRALLTRDRRASDAAWTFPPGDARHADDAALRQLQDVRTLHLRSSTPIARSPAQPAQLLEVPVQPHARTIQPARLLFLPSIPEPPVTAMRLRSLMTRLAASTVLIAAAIGAQAARS
ncbi:hypothetical protein G6F62_012953 [Rhizopus arrhizus]|nr:hypothetical protein G6F62_012953 [Rhizopus arrhizus]